jgi:hypothetical protein
MLLGETQHVEGIMKRPLLVLSAFIVGAHAQAAPLPGGSLDPTTIAKYAAPLVIPPAMPRTDQLPGGIDYYEIAVRQFDHCRRRLSGATAR